MKRRRLTWWQVVLIIVVLFGLIQLIPYGKSHVNPPVVNAAVWDSPQTTTFVRAACYDCHSNETIWPWYSNVAPSSWLVQADTTEGRNRLNLSEWPTDKALQQDLVNRMVRVIQNGQMPPFYYVWMHANAGLTADQKAQFIQGLQNSVK
jgi:hypothetical protein